jgi:exopolysaccharide biosynthesis polyprenyl glycosylphosphotransferase
MVVLESITKEIDTAAAARRRSSRQGSRKRYLILVDIVAGSMASAVVYGGHEVGVAVARQPSVTRNVFTVLMPLVWISVLALHRAYSRWSADSAAKMRGRVLQAALTLIAAMSSACLALHYTALLDLILVGVPLVAVFTVLMRRFTLPWLWARSKDAYARRALVVGHAGPVAGLVAGMSRDHSHDIRVIAACVNEGATDDQISVLPVPVYGGLTDVLGTARAAGCDCVIVSSCPELDSPQLRQLGWDLHGAGIDLLVAPALSDVAEDRIALRPAGGLPLLLVRPPVFTGPRRVLKGLLDRLAALCLLGFAAPAMLGIAVLVRTTSPGPALFRQRRVGRDGKEFTCLKFRTMAVDAEARRAELVHLNERQDGLLFKIRRDPRITRVGGFLRRYSLDELPQLFNVVAGEMSLVGPRPPLPQEVASYDKIVRRRLLVKPGLTGLWQVSGRSELSWAESVRLDLSYVDNWSPALDARILWRTAAAVIKGTGAY